MVIELDDYIKLKLHDASNNWSGLTVLAILAPGLCAPVILGLPFLSHNEIIVNIKEWTAIAKKTGFNLLNPSVQRRAKENL